MLARLLLGAQFQSTLPVWGATAALVLNTAHITISIHAPRVGSDSPRPAFCSKVGFQSTLPVWGATYQGDFLF